MYNANRTPFESALIDAQNKLARTDWSAERKANLKKNFLAVWGVVLTPRQ